MIIVLIIYGKGLCCITVMETPFYSSVDKLITLEDGKKGWVCDYVKNTTLPSQPPVSDEITDLLVAISGSPVGWNTVDFTWNIISDFDIEKTINNNEIKLYIEDEDLANKKFKLQVIINNVVLAENIITISNIM